jgi:hypothetical protein
MSTEAIKSYIGDARRILSKFTDVAREFAQQEAKDREMNPIQALFFVRAETKRIVALGNDFKAAIRQNRRTMEDPYIVLARLVEAAPPLKTSVKNILTANRFFQRLERHAY